MALVDDASANTHLSARTSSASAPDMGVDRGGNGGFSDRRRGFWYLRRAPEQPMLEMEITPPEGAKNS